jgi:hypothetical protein
MADHHTSDDNEAPGDIPAPTDLRRCLAPGCPQRIPARLLTCRAHGQDLPAPLRRRILTARAAGDQADYAEAVAQARRFLQHS